MKIAVLASLTPEHSQLDFYTSDHAQILTTIANMVSAKIADAIKTEELHNTVRQLEISQGKLIEKTTELLSSRNAEQAANRTKSEFLSTMSHEVRTPMNSVIDMADSLAIDASLDEIQKKQVDILKNASFSLLHLSNQIIDLTKLDAHEVLLDEKEVHLQNLITEVCNFANQSDALGREPTVIDITGIHHHRRSTIQENTGVTTNQYFQIFRAGECIFNPGPWFLATQSYSAIIR